MNDFEDRLATLLNESVDAQLAARTVAPPFIPQSDAHVPGGGSSTPRRRSFRVLAVAATVAAIVVAALGLHAFTSSDGLGPAPATHPPATHPPATHRPPTTRSTPTTNPSRHSATKHPAKKPADSLDGADIARPKGWVARPMDGSGDDVTWCLTPHSVAGGTGQTCPVQFARLANAPTLLLDPDSNLGVVGDPGQNITSDHASGSMRDFGGRQAVYYREKIEYSQGRATDYAQYEVLGNPAYLLYTAHPTASILRTLRSIAKHSVLPAQTSKLWRADYGRITSITGSGSTVHLALVRVCLDRSGTRRHWATIARRSVHYTVTSHDLRSGAALGPIKVGSVVMITTNGTEVTMISDAG